MKPNAPCQAARNKRDQKDIESTHESQRNIREPMQSRLAAQKGRSDANEFIGGEE